MLDVKKNQQKLLTTYFGWSLLGYSFAGRNKLEDMVFFVGTFLCSTSDVFYITGYTNWGLALWNIDEKIRAHKLLLVHSNLATSGQLTRNRIKSFIKRSFYKASKTDWLTETFLLLSVSRISYWSSDTCVDVFALFFLFVRTGGQQPSSPPGSGNNLYRRLKKQKMFIYLIYLNQRFIYIYMSMCVCVCVCVFICMYWYVCIYAHVYVYLCIYRYIGLYI